MIGLDQGQWVCLVFCRSDATVGAGIPCVRLVD